MTGTIARLYRWIRHLPCRWTQAEQRTVKRDGRIWLVCDGCGYKSPGIDASAGFLRYARWSKRDSEKVRRFSRRKVS